MRSISLFTSAVLVLLLSLTSVGEVRAAGSGTGYTCVTKDDGELVCTADAPASSSSTGGTGGTTGGTSGGGSGWISKLTGWLSGALSSFFTGIVDFGKDLLVLLLSAVLGLFATIVEAIPVPDFIKNYSVGSLLSNVVGSDLGYFLGVFHIPEGFALIGAGYAFRLLRKVLTLFQW